MTGSERLLAEIAQDHHAGATALTRRAAEALHLHLSEDDALADFEGFADRLAEAQPAMASIRNLAERAKAAARVGSVSNAQNAVGQFVEELDASTERIAREAQSLLSDVDRVVTVSASSTVAAAVRNAHMANPGLAVVCPESRPLREGVTLAESLAGAGLAATVCADALAPSLVRDADIVLVGGDALAPEGLVNKIGTFPLALAAQHVGIPFVPLISRLKLLQHFDERGLAEMDPSEVLMASEASMRVRNRYFELTPLELLTHVVTETGVEEGASFDAHGG